MRIDKKKLFEAIKNGKTELIEFTYSKDDFQYSPQDLSAFIDKFEFRSFIGKDYFELTTFIRKKDLTEATNAFLKLEEELKRLNVVKEEDKGGENE